MDQTKEIKALCNDAEDVGSRFIQAYNALDYLVDKTNGEVGGARAIVRLLDMGDPDVQADHAESCLERVLENLDALRAELSRILGPAPGNKVLVEDHQILRRALRGGSEQSPVGGVCYVEDGKGRLVGTTDNQ